MEELDLKDLFMIFWNKKLVIILFLLLGMAVGTVYSYFAVTPYYKSTTTVVLAQSSTVQQKGQGGITQTDLTLNSKLVSTYSEIIESKGVLSQVIENLNIDDLTVNDIEKLKKEISVESVTDTEIIKISVKNTDPNRAALVANEIAKVFSEKVIEIYNISNIYVLDSAEANEIPYNINHIKDIVIFAFIGLVFAFGYVLLRNMLDTTIKSEQDIENSTDLFVLTSIPDYSVEESKNKRGGKR